MTRKEAIANLNMISVAFVEPVTKEQRELIDDTFYMAIKALDQLTSYEQTINKLTGAIAEQKSLKQEPCEDAINRQAVLDCLTATGLKKYDFILNARDKIKNLPSVKPQEPKTEQFAKWVATEIFDDMWEYNYEAFAEIACRKLAKLGIVTRMGDEWVLVEQQESDEEE